MNKHRYGDNPEIDAEFDLALAETVRRKWMAIVGVPQDEIEAYIKSDPPINLEDELRQLDAARENEHIYRSVSSEEFDSLYRCRPVTGSDGQTEWV